MKGFYPKKENPVQSFFRGKGFYIILIVCLFGVGVLGYVTLKGLNGPPDDQYLYNNQSDTSSDDVSDGMPVLNNQTPSRSQSLPSSSSVSSKSISKNDEDTVDVIAKEIDKLPLAYKKPVEGTVLKRFSLDDLVYSVTLGDYRAHLGVDIAAPKLTQVKAMASGRVDNVYFDETMGWTVEIYHADGVITKYSNLDPTISVKKDDKVKAGRIIGGVGTTAADESKDEPHLHLEAIKNKGQIDPLSLVK